MNTQNIETKIIFLPKNIEIYIKRFNLLLKTKVGHVHIRIPEEINLYKKNSFIYIDILTTDIKTKTWVLSLINLIKGLSRFYINRLILKGVGYKVFVNQNNILDLKIGYSHSIKYVINSTITTNIYKNAIIQLKSPFKDTLGQTCSSLRALKKLDVYKGKGILYNREKINLKVGKKA